MVKRSFVALSVIRNCSLILSQLNKEKRCSYSPITLRLKLFAKNFAHFAVKQKKTKANALVSYDIDNFLFILSNKSLHR
ncbi:hypothetical protein SAMN04488511_10891 [Pedobacter suwonensis]|uniref:Uncharacterized protein n=1 Tax=Pedobacter suwonensis TaxID=332999 RepID=A0A1I0TEL6_9SPHI|nr:hypothetical protein SAMN04488511_10891 [Pedobacter suwonensis]